MKRCGRMLLGLLVAAGAGCGTQPTSLVLGGGSGSLDVVVDGTVDSDISLNLDTTVQADVNCTITCNLNTGECETVCELDEGTPPTPEELGAELYAANCSACHGDPPGTGFAPDLTGKTAEEISNEFDSGHHPGGTFSNLTQEDIDNLAAFLAG